MVKLVGILNITPDSPDGGQYRDPLTAISRAEQLFDEGASIVDVGAESTRPGAVPIGPREEWRRLEPVLSVLLPKYPDNFISVDTHHPDTVERVLQMGNVIINDVTGMNNPDMVHAVVKHRAKCIVSHLPGQEIQSVHNGKLMDNIHQVQDELLEKAVLLQCLGLPREKIILDPGIGFGKTPELNAKLLAFAKYVPGFDVMIGYSRERFLGEYRMDLAPNLAAGVIALNNGAAYLRVHDVNGHRPLMDHSLAV